ncbi:MAG: class I lanthipeptide [Candidatus Aminicenantes bacterium]|nr:class I lanthipeptide [Candidatus Aminicenantes bacterium]
MKNKNFNKKLVLNKKTIIDLNNNEMNKLYGGVETQTPTVCRTRCVTNCDTCPSVGLRTCDC